MPGPPPVPLQLSPNAGNFHQSSAGMYHSLACPFGMCAHFGWKQAVSLSRLLVLPGLFDWESSIDEAPWVLCLNFRLELQKLGEFPLKNDDFRLKNDGF